MPGKNILLLGGGYFFFGMGVVGLLLPVWPTTPFILLSATCFSCSPAIKKKLMRIPFFSEHIHNYETRRGLSQKTLIISLGYLWGMLALSMILIRKLWICLLLAAIGVTVTIHLLFMRKTKFAGKKNQGRKRSFGLPEFIFDLAYLIMAAILGIWLLLPSETASPRFLAGIAALVLAGGDACHLLPRMLAIGSGNEARFSRMMDRGKQIASITMTIFYLLLWQIGLSFIRIPHSLLSLLNVIIYALAILRITVCLLPQNRWQNSVQAVKWNVLRNVPFLLQGAMVGVLYFLNKDMIAGLEMMWLAILLSFAFYIPVVLWVNKNSKVGMLMLPKTCAYLWMLAMCLSL